MNFFMKVLILLVVVFTGTQSRNITFDNHCYYHVWVGIQGPANPEDGGILALKQDQTSIQLNDKWIGGKIWGRTFCANRISEMLDGVMHCETGACKNSTGHQVLKCNGVFGAPPMTVAELSLGGLDGKDEYAVSLELGYNIPIRIEPVDHKGKCQTAGGCSYSGVWQECDEAHSTAKHQFSDKALPMGCKSDCLIHNNDEMCCRGKHASDEACKGTSTSKLFDKSCKNVRKYAYDKKHNYQCSGTDYIVHFC